MMSTNLNILNASPRSIHPGINDESTREVPYTPEQIPQHCPLFMAQTPLGSENVVLTTGDDLMISHGRKTFDPRSKFYSHQTHGMKRCNEQGNLFFFKRLVGQYARKASAVLWLEYIKDLALPYDRDIDGNVIVNNGVKQTTGTPGADEVEIYKFKWTVDNLGPGDSIDDIRGGGSSLTSSIPDESPVMVPILAMEHSDFGAGGNDFGFSLYFPHAASSNPGDVSVMEALKQNVYRMRMMYRDNPRVSPSIVSTTLGSQYIDVPMGQDVFNDLTNRNYSDDDIIEAYELDDPGFVSHPANVGQFHVFEDNIAAIQTILSPIESVFAGEAVEPGQINIFNEFNLQGKDQYSIRFTSDSAVLKAGNVHYFSNGDDGEVGESTLNDLVQAYLNTKFDDPESPLSDVAQFPFSDLYDTGFNYETKLAMLSVMGKRPDVYVSVCTQDLALPSNDAATEYSMGTALYSAARIIPESVLNGTPACRAAIFGQVGNVTANDHIKKARYPLIMDIITKRSAYMGAADGEYDSALPYDSGTNRHVTNFNVKSVTHPWKPESAYYADWAAGINTCRFIDRRTLFWPGIKSVYSNDTSVLNSDINVHICCDVIRRQHLVWAMLTGDATLTQNEVLSESVRIMTNLTNNRYDDRVSFEFDARRTPADEARGYSWVLNAIAYLNNMPTVATMEITARRSSDLTA